MYMSEPTHYYTQETTLERLKIRNNDHVFSITLSNDYMEQYPNNDWVEDFDYFLKKLDFYSQFYQVIHTYYDLKKQYDPLINSFMFSIYLICWSYVLYTGNYHLSYEFFHTYEIILEPFSGLPLSIYENNYDEFK